MLTAAWATTSYQEGDLVHVANRVYVAESTGVNTSGSSAPTHTSGSASDGNMLWKYLRIRTDGNLFQGGWTTVSSGSSYVNGTYINVPLITSDRSKRIRCKSNYCCF